MGMPQTPDEWCKECKEVPEDSKYFGGLIICPNCWLSIALQEMVLSCGEF
jgi:hypothetical protein